MLPQESIAKSKCKTYTDCKTCTLDKSWNEERCQWCPLDRECHDPSSSENPCLKNLNIVNPKLCRENKYGKYDPHSAFLHTLMSAAAYSKDPKMCLQKMNATKDFEIKDIIKHDCKDLPLFTYKECVAYTAVSHTHRVITLAFRGTRTLSSQIFDQIISVLTIPKVPFPTGGEVQRYFANAHKKLYNDVNASVTTLVKMYPEYNFVVTGHSLGGALASLAAVTLAYQHVIPLRNMAIYTFGEPRVGDKNFAFNYDRLVNNSWRVVHNRDIISHLPLCSLFSGCSTPDNGPFHHRTEIFYPNVTMEKDSFYKECRGDDSYNCSDGMIQKKPCTFDIKDCLTYHMNYFSLHVGRLCDHVLTRK